MSNIKGILFDFNGTLFFDSHFHIRAFEEYFLERGKEKPTPEFIIHNIFGRSNPRIYADNFDPDPTDEDCRIFADRKEGLYRKFCLESPEEMHLCDGAPELLDFLKENGIPYCLATGSGLDNVSFYMENMGLGRWFDMNNIIYADGSFSGKPEPDAYILAAKKIGLSPSECIVFEDGTSGIVAARRAEAGAVIALYDHTLPSPFTDGVECDAVYPDLTDWKEILKKFGVLR